MFLIAGSVFASCNLERPIQDWAIIITVFLSGIYFMLFCYVLAWQYRRMRVASILRAPALQSFDAVFDNEEIVMRLPTSVPLFSHALSDRCPVLLHRRLGDWTVMIFDWLDKNQHPPRREWITIALVGQDENLPKFRLEPHSRVSESQFLWWLSILEPHMFIMRLIEVIAAAFKTTIRKDPLAIFHTPDLTRGYQLATDDVDALARYLKSDVCEEIIELVDRKKRFLMVDQNWLVLASNNKIVSAHKLGELAADAVRLTDAILR